jgi:hypothetical protein
MVMASNATTVSQAVRVISTSRSLARATCTGEWRRDHAGHGNVTKMTGEDN